ncbi:MAG: NACHT domain-containing protein [Nitrososphaera sp.]|nr:NACHT domain-containing protein [Nitrososphaera sp.]
MPSSGLHDLLNQLAQTLADQSDVPATLIHALREVGEAAVQGGVINIGGDIITATGSSIVINRSDHAQVIINRPDAATLVTAILQVRQQMADEQTAESRERVAEYLTAVRDYCANLPYLSLHGLLQQAGGSDTFSLGQSYIDVQVRQLRDMTELGGDWELDLKIKEASIRNDDREFSRLQAERERRKQEGNLRSRPARAEERQRWQEQMSQAVEAQDQVAFLRMKRYLEWAPITVAEMMQQHPLLLILGEGGAGKSTLLRHLAEGAWDVPEQIGLDKPHLPLLIPLRQLARADGSLEDRLNQVLTSELMLMQKLPDGFFIDWSAQTGTPWLILLDALDEVPMDERTRLIQWLISVLRNIGHHRVVIASRPPGYMSGEFGELFHHYELISFTPKQTDEFAHKWFGDTADRFLKEFEYIRAGDLQGTPLLLTIAAKVYLAKDTLPERRSALYGQFVNIWLSEAEQRGLKAELGERVDKVSKFALARIALKMTESSEEASEATLTQEAASYLHDALRLSDDEAEVDGAKFVLVMARRSGMFTRRGDTYNFIHPTFREYLAAEACIRECDRDLKKIQSFIGLRWKTDKWREVVLFIIGILSDNGMDVTELIQEIAKTGNDGLFFAGSCLIERARVSSDLWEYINNQLLELANDEKAPLLTQVAVAELLGKLGQASKLRNNFLSLAQDNTIDDWAATMLNQLGLANLAASILQEMIDSPKMSLGERQSAIEALRKLGYDESPTQQEDESS